MSCTHHWARRSFVATIVSAGLLATGSVLAAGSAAGVVATHSEPAWTGPLPAEMRKSQATLHQWLTANSAHATRKASDGFSISLTRQDLASIGQSGKGSDDPVADVKRLRVGVAKGVGENVDFTNVGRGKAGGPERGAIRMSKNGFVWTAVARSHKATALRLHFTGFDLPKGAEVYVYNDKGQAYGPYTGKGPLSSGEFWTNTVNGSAVYLQVHYNGSMQAKNLRGLGFEVADIAHLGPRFLLPRYTGKSANGKAFCSYNASCVENASCYSSSDWGAIDQARGGVAHIQFVSGPYVYICSGGLLNDTDDSGQIPYFLTANHCVSKDSEASSLEAFWQYASSCGSCNDSLGSVPSTLGAAILESNSTSDYTLMQLDEQPPTGSVFMGWTSEEVAFTDGYGLYRISHPQGAPQAYSEHDVDTSKGTCRTWPRGDWIYSHDQVGATEGGSSGSPVLNASGQVVGQLSGACGTNTGDVCDTQNNATVDGALAAYYSTVASYLDPSDGGGGGGDIVAHVSDISLSTRRNGNSPWYRGVATVTVVDDGGSPVANATVDGTFSGDISGSYSGTTDSNGVAVIESDKARNVSSFGFCVDSISGSGISYDSSADAESCDNF